MNSERRNGKSRKSSVYTRVWLHIHIHSRVPMFCERVKPPWNLQSANETCPALTDYMSVAWGKGKHKLWYWHRVRPTQERCSDKAPVPHLSSFCKCLGWCQSHVVLLWWLSYLKFHSNSVCSKCNVGRKTAFCFNIWGLDRPVILKNMWW